MPEIGRREFLKMVVMTGTAAAAPGCSDSTRRLIPYVTPPEDIVPGDALWLATTCRECPAGCGLLAKNRDGRAVKAEGLPGHPVGAGKLCARGQAALQGLYNPDRFRGPMQRMPAKGLQTVTWDQGLAVLLRNLTEAARKPGAGEIVFLTGHVTGAIRELIDLWLAELGAPAGRISYEPLAHEPLRRANELVFGRAVIPRYRIDQADCLISFNAGFLETWLSNVEYTRQFARFRNLNEGGKNPFIFVGPRLSLTAANADLWIPVPPGKEALVAMGILQFVLREFPPATVGSEQRRAMLQLAEPWPVQRIVEETGVSEGTIRKAAGFFAQAKRPLALAEGLPFTVPHCLETAVAANLLSAVSPGIEKVMDFGSPSTLSETAGSRQLKEMCDRIQRGEVRLLLIHDVNPVHFVPRSWRMERTIHNVPTVVSFSSSMDETSTLADLVLPTHTPLESWGDHSPRKGIHCLMQPVMGPVFDTRHLGDILLETGRRIKGTERFPWNDFHDFLQDSWKKRWEEEKSGSSFLAFWQESLRRGGTWAHEGSTASTPGFRVPEISFHQGSGTEEECSGLTMHFTTYPTVQFFDGRGANRLWLQELPDPLTQVTWGGWVEIHPDTARELDIKKGDVLRVQAPHGHIEAPALPIYTVPPGTIAIPLGQGHTAYGQFADGLPANPMGLMPGEVDPTTGGILHRPFRVALEKTGQSQLLANTDGSFYQHGRGFVQTMAVQDYRKAANGGGPKPYIELPMPEGYDPTKDFYPPHEHKDYRWAMVVDLDRCVACGACVVACYAENNVAVVRREQVLKEREMSWLRIQRYFEEESKFPRFLPMLCQHCDNAPCESVCPVYAPHHSKEGLNNQIYNRCFGTRFCSQNDPYKVRRFNYFTYTRPEPLNWQLNPDVLVRQKGVMEKCSFCVQRIAEGKAKAREQGRKVQDGDFTTACAQTCPTDALVFGNLMDPHSRVAQLVKDPRAYQVLVHLNTKPAVFYLKRVVGVVPA